MKAEMSSAASKTVCEAAPVSAVIPCYRCAATVERAVASVLAQTLPVAEIILVDDASGDDTLEALMRLQGRQGDGRIRVVASGENRGAGEARNLGWAEASQPWIAFLDADDAWHPRKIEIQYRWLAEHPDAVLCAHGTIVAQVAEWPLPAETGSGARRVDPSWLPFSNSLPMRSVMVRREIPYRFYPGKRYAEDFALWLKIVLSGLHAYKLDVPLACSFRPEFSGSGSSAKLWRVERGELDALATLRAERLLPAYAYVLAVPWSLLKFLRRVLLRNIFCTRHGT